MKRSGKINSISLLVLKLCLLSSMKVNAASMSQGKHEIVLDKAESIKKNLSEVKKATEESTQKVDQLTVQEEEAFNKSLDEKATRKQRLGHLANSLNHRTDIYLEIKNLVDSNGKRLVQVERDLDEIDRSLANSPYLMNDPKTIDAVEQVRKNLTNSIKLDQKLSILAEKASLDGKLSPKVQRAYQMSQAQLASAIQVTSSPKGKNRGERFREQVDQLRSSVRARRTRMAMIGKVTDRSLREIEVFAATQATKVIFDEVDESLRGITSDTDPLGLEILQPETNDRYWNWDAEDQRQFQQGSPAYPIQAFVPIGERINPNQL